MECQRTIAIILIAATALAGCTTTYSETLEHKLAGKPLEEKRIILAKECGHEIQRGLKPEKPANVRHFQRMEELCEVMTGQKVDVTLFAVPNKQ